MHTEKTPLLIGLRAARANFVPGLILQVLMVALVVSYYTVPAMHAWLSVLATAKQNGGYPFSIITSALAGGVLPEILIVIFLQRCKVTGENWLNLLFGICFWGFDGLSVDVLYRLQGVIFGNHVDFATVVKKVLVDQLIYSPFYASTLTMGCYEWKNQGYSFHGMWRIITPAFYKNKTFPSVIASWAVWFPLVAIIYSLPQLLQFPLFCLGLTFWVMIFTYIASVHKQKSALPFSTPVGDASAFPS